LNKLVSAGRCGGPGGRSKGIEVVIGGGNVPIGGWGVVGSEADDDGGGMRKGTAPKDVAAVDDIRTTGNDGV